MSNIEIKQAIKTARELLDKEQALSPAFRAAMSVMFMAVSILLGRVNLNSSNSSKPPSSDPNRKKKSKGKGLKRGGQPGHVGTTLKQFDEVDEITELKVDRSKLPSGNFTHAGYEKRQVVDIEFRRVVTAVRMRYAMRTTCGNWSAHGSRMSSSGQSRCKNCYVR